MLRRLLVTENQSKLI